MRDSSTDIVDITREKTRAIQLINQAQELTKDKLELKISLAQQALNISEETNYSKGIGESKILLGIGYLSQSKYDKSISLLFEALPIFKDLKDKKTQIYILNKIGSNYFYLGNFHAALEYYEKGLTIAKGIKENQKVIADHYVYIGTVHNELEEFDKAKTYYLKALNFYNEDSDKIVCLHNIATSYLHQGQYDDSLKYLDLTAELLQNCDHILAQVENWTARAAIYKKQNRLDLAHKYYQEALEHLEKNRSEELFYKSDIYLNLGSLAEDNNNHLKAFVHYNKALELASQIGAKKILLSVYQGLSNCYQGIHDYKESLNYYKMYNHLKKVIYNEKTKNKIEQIKTQHEVEEARRDTEQIEKSYQMLRTINQLGQKLISTFDIGEILMEVYHLTNNLMDASIMGIGLYNSQKKVLFNKLIIENGERLPEYSISIENRDSLSSWCIRNQKTIFIQDLETEYHKYVKKPLIIHGETTQAIICLPLLIENKVVGLLSVQSMKKNAYQPQDLETLNILSPYIAIALDNTQNFQTEKQKRLMAESLQELSSLLTSTLDLKKVLDRFLFNLSKLINFHQAIVLLKKGQSFQPVAVNGIIEIANISTVKLLIDQHPFLGKIIDKASPQLTDKINTEIFSSGLNSIKSWYGVPLLTGKEIVGILLIGHQQNCFYNNKDLDFVSAYASQAAIAINNARLFEKVNTLASQDSLTGLYNRRVFFELASKEFQQASRYNYPISVIIFDVDFFKDFNDNFGHLLGDKILCKIAKVCADNIRKADIIARYGGEEFVILSPMTNLEGGEKAAEKLRSKISDTSIISQEYGNLSVTCSFGVAAGDTNLDRLLSRADKALYLAKNNGRNRVESIN